MNSLGLIFTVVFSVILATQAKTLGQSNAAVIEDCPYIATVEVGDKVVCAATVMDDYFVMTTNTCAGALDVNSVYVRVGTAKLGHRGQLYKATKITFYTSVLSSSSSLSQSKLTKKQALSLLRSALEEGPGGGGSTVTEDMAMIKVATPFTYGPSVMFLRPNNDGITEGQTATVPVWTDTLTTGSSLLTSDVTVMNSTECTAAYNNSDYTISSGMFCLSGDNICLSNMGSPLYYNEQLYGLVTYNPGCNSSLPVVALETADRTSFIITALCELSSLYT